MADITELQTRLTEAETARHKLLTGILEVTVSISNYGSASYAQADISKLERYISQLKNDIAKLKGSMRRGPILTRF